MASSVYNLFQILVCDECGALYDIPAIQESILVSSGVA